MLWGSLNRFLWVLWGAMWCCAAPQAFREEGRALDHHSHYACYPKAALFVDACGLSCFVGFFLK